MTEELEELGIRLDASRILRGMEKEANRNRTHALVVQLQVMQGELRQGNLRDVDEMLAMLIEDLAAAGVGHEPSGIHAPVEVEA